MSFCQEYGLEIGGRGEVGLRLGVGARVVVGVR